MRSLYITLIAALLMPVSGSAWAQASEETPWYNIEVFVFARGGNAGVTEQWPVAPGTPEMGDVAVLQPAQTVLEGVIEPYSEIPKAEWQLAAEFRRLARTGGRLQPLLHTAWRQPVVDKGNTKPLFITASNDVNKVDGIIQVSVQRYLHVDLDLVLSDPNTIPSSQPIIEGSPNPLLSQPTQYRFQAHRKMRSEELHYIDHPKMGVVILATKFEFTEQEVIPQQPEESAPVEAATSSASNAVSEEAAPSQSTTTANE